MSSPAETLFSLEDSSPNRIAFDLQRVMRTKYIIDDFQQTYFVIDSFEKLLEDCYQDFGPVYDRLRTVRDIEAHELAEGDRVIARGDLHYFRAKGKRSTPRRSDRLLDGAENRSALGVQHFDANGVARFQKWRSRLAIQHCFNNTLLSEAGVTGAALGNRLARPSIRATV